MFFRVFWSAKKRQSFCIFGLDFYQYFYLMFIFLYVFGFIIEFVHREK